MKSKASVKKVDTVFFGYYTRSNLLDFLSLPSRMGLRTQAIADLQKNISKLSGALPNEDGEVFPLYGDWSSNKGGHHIFTFYTSIPRTSQLGTFVEYGTTLVTLLRVNDLEIPWICASIAREKDLTLSQNILESTLQKKTTG